MKESYEFVVVGGGSAGYAAARTAVGLGLKTAVVDGADVLGGLCILRGCMPSKTLIESANRYRTLRRAQEFGLRAEGLSVRGPEIIARKRRLIGEFAEYRQGQLESGKFELIRGKARFVDATRLLVEPRGGGEAFEIGAATTLIATGSEISVPAVAGIGEVGYLTSDDVLELETIPESVIVLGGGAIAVEMAHYLEGVGSRVTVVQRSDQLLRGMDRDVAKALEGALSQRMTVHTGTVLRAVRRSSTGGIEVEFKKGEAIVTESADELLVALGRHPAIRGLELGNAGVEVAGGAVKVADGRQRTTAENIFAAGDVCGPLEVVHLAIEQGEIAAEAAAAYLGREAPRREMDYRLKLFGIFTDPQVGVVGLGEEEAREAGRDVVAASYGFDDHGKSMTMGETEGFVKIVADRATGEILGAAAVGPEAVELIHELVVAMYFRATVVQFAKVPHYHPTLSEIWTYPAEELADLLG